MPTGRSLPKGPVSCLSSSAARTTQRRCPDTESEKLLFSAALALWGGVCSVRVCAVLWAQRELCPEPHTLGFVRPGPGDWPGLAQGCLASSLRLSAHRASRSTLAHSRRVLPSDEGHCLPGVLIVSQPQQPQLEVRQLWFLVLPLLSYKYRFGDLWTGMKLPSVEGTGRAINRAACLWSRTLLGCGHLRPASHSC